MAYLEELLPEFKKGTKIRMKNWPKPFYLQMKDEKVYNQDNNIVRQFSHQAVFEDVWEFYKEPEPDWQKIIDNKYLCWFWDYDEVNKIMGFLTRVNENSTLCRFTCRTSAGNSYSYVYCRPVRKDEVTFYEDKKDD